MNLIELPHKASLLPAHRQPQPKPSYKGIMLNSRCPAHRPPPTLKKHARACSAIPKMFFSFTRSLVNLVPLNFSACLTPHTAPFRFPPSLTLALTACQTHMPPKKQSGLSLAPFGQRAHSPAKPFAYFSAHPDLLSFPYQ